MRFDDDDDEYGPDESAYRDSDSADDDFTDQCPYCQKPIYDDSIRCAYCGNYLSHEDAPSRKPVWFVIGIVLCLAVALMWALGG